MDVRPPSFERRDGVVIGVRAAGGSLVYVADALRAGRLTVTSLTGAAGGPPGRPLTGGEIDSR